MRRLARLESAPWSSQCQILVRRACLDTSRHSGAERQLCRKAGSLDLGVLRFSRCHDVDVTCMSNRGQNKSIMIPCSIAKDLAKDNKETSLFGTDHSYVSYGGRR